MTEGLCECCPLKMKYSRVSEGEFKRTEGKSIAKHCTMGELIAMGTTGVMFTTLVVFRTPSILGIDIYDNVFIEYITQLCGVISFYINI